MALLPNEVEHNMVCGESDSRHDVILRILKVHADNIASGVKNHEFRKYRLEADVYKVWLYVDEEKTIEYVLTVGPPKIMGQINDPTGLGNEDFDQGRKISPFGYPIYAVHRIPRALTTAELLDDYGVDMTSRGKQYAKRALVDAFPLETLELVVPK